MNILLNMKPHQFESAQTLADLIETLSIDQQQLAAAVNQTLVPRTQWHLLPIQERDVVDLFSTIAGG